MSLLDREPRAPRARPGVGSSLVFAAGAALGTLFWVLSAAPFLGYETAAASWALGSVVLHSLFVARGDGRGVAAAALTCVIEAPLACLGPGVFVAFAAMPFLLGLARSIRLHPQPFARTLLLESGLGVASLLSALFFYDGSVIGTVFALWSFWLIQAVFALVPGDRARPEDPSADPFDRAHAAALTLLDRRR